MFKTEVTLGINIHVAFAVQFIKRSNVTHAITTNSHMTMQMSLVLVHNIIIQSLFGWLVILLDLLKGCSAVGIAEGTTSGGDSAIGTGSSAIGGASIGLGSVSGSVSRSGVSCSFRSGILKGLTC